MFRRPDVAERGGSRVHERWARLRFSIIGALLAAPPAKGALRAALEALAAREWRHPSTGEPVRFSASTLERWFYRSRNERHARSSSIRRSTKTPDGS
jgi:putative transposase